MALLAPVVTPAHGVGSRSDLPLPFTALVIAAVAALVISFVAIGTLWREPRLRDTDGRLLPGAIAALLDSRWLRVVARTFAAVLTVWTLAALVLGPDSARNPVPHVVYVWLWVGLAFSSMLLGPVWRVINPLRALHAGCSARPRPPRHRGAALPLGPVAGRDRARHLHVGRARGR